MKDGKEIDPQEGRHAFKKQVLSTQKSSLGYTMRPPAQLPERLLKIMQGQAYPGPDKASQRTSFAKQSSSRNRSAPGYTFSGGKTFS